MVVEAIQEDDSVTETGHASIILKEGLSRNLYK